MRPKMRISFIDKKGTEIIIEGSIPFVKKWRRLCEK